MGISTVSGPFRSKNGFQQLDENGQWVPVTGGGGGGSNTAIIFNPSTDGSTVNIILPPPTAVGQIYTVSNSFIPASFGDASIIPTLLDGQDSVMLRAVRMTVNGTTTIEGGVGPYTFTMTGVFSTLLYIVYTGNMVYDDVTYAVYNCSQTYFIGI